MWQIQHIFLYDVRQFKANMINDASIIVKQLQLIVKTIIYKTYFKTNFTKSAITRKKIHRKVVTQN